MQILSAFAGGLWIIPLMTFIGGLYFLIVAYKASRSGSTQQTKSGVKDGGNVPMGKIGQFWFSVALFVATIGIMIWMINER